MNTENVTLIDCVVNYITEDKIAIIENGQVVEIKNEEN